MLKNILLNAFFFPLNCFVFVKKNPLNCIIFVKGGVTTGMCVTGTHSSPGEDGNLRGDIWHQGGTM